MLEVLDQYIYIFSIGNKKDFIFPADLDYFSVIEEAGNVLPTWKMSFRTTDPDLLRVLNEGNDLKVNYGINRDKLIEVPLLITKRTINKAGDQKFQIELLGIYSKLEYVTISHVTISGVKSGIEVLIEIARAHFNVVSNISSSEDSQNWIQPNIVDKRFVDELWLHSYVTDSFLGIGITSDGKFIIKDIKQAIRDIIESKKGVSEVVWRPKFKFTSTPEKSNDISYVGDSYFQSNAGFINCWVGYGKEKPVYVLESDGYSKKMEQISPLLALTNTLNRRASIEKRHDIVGMQNDNVHGKYWQAYLRNIAGLSVFSSDKLTLSFGNVLNDIKIFDIAMYKEDMLDDVVQSEEYYSGLYAVGLVGRTLSKNQLITTVELFRESFNTQRGDLR